VYFSSASVTLSRRRPSPTVDAPTANGTAAPPGQRGGEATQRWSKAQAMRMRSGRAAG